MTGRMGWSQVPMLAFDTETTGISVESDRVVTATCARVNITPQPTPASWLIDPGVDIPDGATAVHGITTAQAQAHGVKPRVALDEIRATLELSWGMGHPVVAYNATYDLTILDRELRRHGMAPLEVTGLVIDPLVLDRMVDRFRRGSRKLEATCAHYRVALDGAHDATQDALAAARVAWRILRAHPELDAMPAAELMRVQAEAHRAWAVEFEAHLARQGREQRIGQAWPLSPEGSIR